jgi:hypothetical protein
MNLNAKALATRVTSKVGRQMLVAKKNSPHIFFVGGVVGVVGSTVLACRATLKLEAKLDEIRDDVALVKAKSIEQIQAKSGELTETQQRTVAYTCTTYTTVKTVKAVGRLYGPALLLGGASIAALTGSHIQLTRRNAALSATLALVTKAYEEYRVRIQQEIGVERERDIYKGVTTAVDKTKGGKTELDKLVDSAGHSPYAVFFDESSTAYENDPEINLVFLRCLQNYYNQKLVGRGHVFLNEVLDDLGLPRTQAGQVVGWVLNGDGDGYIDFGIAKEGNFVRNNLDRAILLDFNVDGEVFTKI